MKLRYMIDSIVADREATVPEYVPVGVWVQGPGPGLDVEMYLSLIHISEPTRLLSISYAVFCLKKKQQQTK